MEGYFWGVQFSGWTIKVVIMHRMPTFAADLFDFGEDPSTRTRWRRRSDMDWMTLHRMAESCNCRCTQATLAIRRLPSLYIDSLWVLGRAG